MADTFNLVFSWPHTDANTVIATGTFDNWSSSLHLTRTASGFTGSVAVPWDSKIIYKFVVDGNWVTHSDQQTEYDGAGNINNVVHTPPKPSAPQPAEDKEVAIKDVTEAEVAPEESKEKVETPAQIAPTVPVTIQPVLDASTDTLSEGKPVDSERGPSTHSPTAAAEVPVTTEAAPEAPSEDAESPAPPAPVTPPQKKAELPEAPSAPSAAPVTPIKTNGATHSRTSTGTSTPPSSSAPSTPKTQSTFPSISPDKDNAAASPGKGSLGRQKRNSIFGKFGKIKDVFRSPGKEKKDRLGSNSPRSASPSPRKSDK